MNIYDGVGGVGVKRIEWYKGRKYWDIKVKSKFSVPLNFGSFDLSCRLSARLGPWWLIKAREVSTVIYKQKLEDQRAS